ncbi:hypothetical protein [Marinobacter caseinilyticus]|uniref:hypothetical protein n=1 Tax=Marinobacter caseinilyticus TaxID=2692195 RepID=UPI001407E9B1|nr:hypothetical protein [Marinobacter caseinilyticus]
MTRICSRYAGLGIVLACSLLAMGCVPSSSIKPVENLTQVGTGSVIVVGKIELEPGLAPDEQVLGSNFEEFRDLALVITDTELRTPNETMSLGDLTRRINAPMGQTFYVGHEAQPFYILKSWVVMNAEIKVVSPSATPVPGNAPLSGIFKVEMTPGDRAIYIGTIRYHRDPFFSTEKVEVIDDFAQATIDFKQKFGTQIALRKSLAQPIGQ